MCLSDRLLAVAGLVMVSVFPIAGTTINITPGAGLVGNTAALAAFNRAANTWAAMFSDPVTINIDANLGFLAPNVIGQASSVQLVADYDAFRDALAFDASDESDDAIVGFLPTRAQLSASLPAGVTLSNNMQSTKANLKALGVSGLDELFGSSDASITFNSNFGFDYDRLDGTVGVDFESVALHEIGHALGFVSAVDTIDNLTGPTIVNIFHWTCFDSMD